jgi:predicted amidohydrolase YtcJ
LNPFLNMMLAAIHPANPSEAVTVQESLVTYTRGSPFAEFAGGEKATLARGKLADFAVLSQDIFAVPPSELPKTTSALTLVGGRIVHGSR